MAELTPLYMDISGVYSGNELGLPYRDLIGEGIVGSGDLAVTQRAAGANLSVDVAPGAAWVLGDTNPDAQPCYRVRNDATVNLGISPDPSNPRYVDLVAQIVDETFAGVGRQWSLQAIHGTPAASPVEPALPDSALKLAVITVPAAAASIVNANIADTRTRARVGGGSARSGCVAYGTSSAPVSTAGTTFATGADLLATALTFEAKAGKDYVVKVSCDAWTNNEVHTNYLRLNLDGADAGFVDVWDCPQVNYYMPVQGSTPLIGLTPGTHTVNVRLIVKGGTAAVSAGAGGANTYRPILVTIEEL